MRYEIRHPCVNDGDMTLWRELGISSWPTLAVVSPRGRLIATLPGQPLIMAAQHFDGIDEMQANESKVAFWAF